MIPSVVAARSATRERAEGPTALPGGPERERVVLAVLTLAVVASVVVLFRFVGYNLPAAAHVDERTGLRVLLRFHDGSLDPGYFHYPTLLYYVVFALAEILGGPARYLWMGRLIVVLSTAGLGLATFWLVRTVTAESLTALGAALLVLVSPTVVESSSYVATDVPLTLLCTISLTLFLKSRQDPRLRTWVLAMVMAGLAISVKYTGGTLVMALMAAEILWPRTLRARSPRLEKIMNARLPGAAILAVFGAAALVLLGVGIAAPSTALERVLRGAGDLNSVLESSDLAFIQSRFRALAAVGAALGVLAIVLWRRPRLLERFTPVRLYAGGLLAVVVFLAGSPYVLLSFDKFLYDLGAEMKGMAMMPGGSAHWLAYPAFFISAHGAIAGALVVAGLLLGWRTPYRRFLFTAGLFLGVHYLVVGSGHKGFPRYFLPVFPVLFLFAAVGTSALVGMVARWRRTATAAVVALLALGVGLHVAPLDAVLRRRAATPDEMHASLAYLTTLPPNLVYEAGFIPDAELRMAGVPVQEIPEASLARPDLGLPAGPELGSILLLDTRTRAILPDSGWTLVWHDDNGFGQYVFVPSHAETLEAAD